MNQIVIDTNVIFDWRRGRSPLLGTPLQKQFAGELRLLLPTIVILELWAGSEMQQSLISASMDKLLTPLHRIDLNPAIAKQAGTLVRNHLVPHPIDAIIATTALDQHAALATGYSKHFKQVPGLTLYR